MERQTESHQEEVMPFVMKYADVEQVAELGLPKFFDPNVNGFSTPDLDLDFEINVKRN